ncbi:MAG TPA: GNAT family N-acetyltransferase [Verrucomicrobiae bacterium]|nr:GNAT family N-acetyltransferase [Verrucomicrobiae bacterium]
MANLELIPPEPQHIPELARICFEAFKGIHDRHAFPRDIPNIELATHIIGLFLSGKNFHGVAARVDGRLVGSNFISCMDPVGGVGPITVDPAYDGRGVGRALMKSVLDYARQNGIAEVRLQQDSFNTKSFSLYASLGFDLRTPIGLMDAKAAAAPDPTVRPATAADLPALEELSRRLYKCVRRGEIAMLMDLKIPVFLRECGGKVIGYFIPGFLGHGAAETESDALALIGETMRHVPPEFTLFFCPLIPGNFYRAVLKSGHRLRKIMTYMTVGPYEPPEGIWLPSIGY